MELFDISGKKGIVTGATRGIGKAIAKGLHDAGVKLVITGTSEKIFDVAEELSKTGAKVWGVVADFKDCRQIDTAFEKAMEYLDNEIDILVNNAGIQIRHDAEDFPFKDWMDILNVNLNATFSQF